MLRVSYSCAATEERGGHPLTLCAQRWHKYAFYVCWYTVLSYIRLCRTRVKLPWYKLYEVGVFRKGKPYMYMCIVWTMEKRGPTFSSRATILPSPISEQPSRDLHTFSFSSVSTYIYNYNYSYTTSNLEKKNSSLEFDFPIEKI